MQGGKMNTKEIIEQKIKYLEDKRKEIPYHIVEMGLNMLYEEPIDLKEIFNIQKEYKIFEFQNYDLDKDYKIEKDIDALIINTDNTEGGTLESLAYAKTIFEIPVIAKDVFIEEYQVYLSRIYKADGILIQPLFVDDEKLEKVSLLSIAMGITPVFELKTLQDIIRLKKFDFVEFVSVKNEELLNYDDTLKYRVLFYGPKSENLVKKGVKIFIQDLM